MTRRLAHAAATALIVAGLQTAASAQSTAANGAPTKLADLVQQGAEPASAALRARGYTLAHSDTLRGKLWQYWWHAGDDACAMATVNGARVERIVSTAESDCVPKGGNAWRMSSKGKVTDKAARQLGVDALMHRSHERDESVHNSVAAVAEFERGYRDGLKGVALARNAPRGAFADGVQAGLTRRTLQAAAPVAGAPTAAGAAAAANPAQPNTLIGLRGAVLETVMRNHGYVRHSGFAKGRESFVVWRAGPRQCLRTVARDDVVVEYGDVGESECT
jgi:hypothetical protein